MRNEIPTIDLSSIPTIEIDTDYWKTLTPRQRFTYLVKLLFQEKNIGDKMQMMNSVIKTTCRIVKALSKNKDLREYMTVLEYSGDMINTSMVFKNLVRPKQSFRNTRNNDIAKQMGFPNGSHIDETELEVTNTMIEAFLEMSDSQKSRYDIKIDNIVTDDRNKKKQGDVDDDSLQITNKKVTIVGEYKASTENAFKFAIVANVVGTVFEGDANTNTTKAKLFYPVYKMKMQSEVFESELQKVFYELFVEKVDARKNYIKINGNRFEVAPRIQIKENIVNVDIDRIAKACNKTLDEKRRRGVVLVGEPGTGKTIAIHKIINGFSDRLAFWVSADSINTAGGIRNIKRLFKMFEGCIVVFDDLDAAPLTIKNETTNEFLAMLDGTNKMSCFLLATVNDPSKIHMSLINRAERFDDIVHVKKPQTIEEVANIFFSKAREFGYYPKGYVMERSPFYSTPEQKGTISFTEKNKRFVSCCKKVIDNGFTQVMVAGLMRDCDTYSDDGVITIGNVEAAIQHRLESIECANMKAIKGRLEVDMNDISDEAKASLISRHYL